MSQGWLRVGLFFLAVPQLFTGAWALLAPRNWYGNFPGAGHAWVSALGPYDEHLVRDVGAALLAFGILLSWAAVSLAPALVRPALVTWLVFAIPHLIYHIVTAHHLSALDNALNLGGLAIMVVIPLALLFLTRIAPAQRSPGSPAKPAFETSTLHHV